MSTHKGQYRLSNMELDFVSLVAAGDDPLAKVVISKAAPVEERTDPPKKTSTISPSSIVHKEKQMPINKTDLDPEVVEYIEGLETEVDTLSSQVEKSEADLTEKDAEIESLKGTLAKSAPKDDEAADEINKALLAKADPAVRALIEKAQADTKAANDIAKAEREQRLTREFISKAESMPMLTEEKTALADLLRHASETLSEDDNKTLDTVLKAANEQISKGNLFTSFGVGGGETTISKSIKAKAEDIRKAQPDLTQEQAEALALEQNPDLAMAAMNGEEN